MKTYTFKIQGMTCHGCANIIRMDLEEAGYTHIQNIDHTTGVLNIDLEADQDAKVKEIIELSNGRKYKIL